MHWTWRPWPPASTKAQPSPATGPFAPSEPWARRKQRAPKQDLEAAKKLLADAGYTADRPLEIIAIVERAEFADVAAVIQENLKAVGIPVTIQTKEYAAAEPDVLAGNYDMLLSQRNRLIDIADPIGFLTADYTCDGHLQPQPLLQRGVRPDRRRGGQDRGHRRALQAVRGSRPDPRRTRPSTSGWSTSRPPTPSAPTSWAYVQDPLSRYVLTAKTAKSGS